MGSNPSYLLKSFLLYRLNLVILNKTLKFQAHLSAKFQWIFDDEEDEEDKPVVVDMAA